MKKTLLKVLIVLLNIVYFFIKLLPTKNKVVMISRQSNSVNLDFKLLGKELEKKHKVVYLCKKLEGGVNSGIKERIKYGLHMFKQMKELATSKVCVLDSYSPAVSILKHKKSLKIVQIWHSIGTMKRFGYTALGKEEGSKREIAEVMKMHKNYDLVCSSSKAYIDHLASGFGIDENKIEVYTLPRIDLLNDKKYEIETKEKIFKEYPSLKEKTNIVYCPTFRKDETLFYEKLNELVESIDYNKYNLIVKIHPLSKAKIEDERVICDRKFSTFDMLFIADKVITDYSCVLYEAGVRNIPLYFYCFDLEEYLNKRGIALDYKELPGYQEKDAKKLSKTLNNKYDMDYLRKFINKYVSNTKDCAKKMANRIESYME